jgi:hypothetical protein
MPRNVKLNPYPSLPPDAEDDAVHGWREEIEAARICTIIVTCGVAIAIVFVLRQL